MAATDTRSQRGPDGLASAAKVEQFFGPTASCEPGTAGWDYDCEITDLTGIHKHFGVAANERGPFARTAPLPLGQSLPVASQVDLQTRERFARGIDWICRSLRVKRSRLQAPTTYVEATTFVARFRAISKWYLNKLAGLTPPHPDEMSTYDRLLALMARDIRDATDLLAAIRSRDPRSISQLKADLGERAVREARIHTRLCLCIGGRARPHPARGTVGFPA